MRSMHARLRLIAGGAAVSLFAGLGLASPAAANAAPAAGHSHKSVAPADGTNLAAGRPVTESGHVFNFVPENAVDNNVGTYWEGASNSYPDTLSVNLGVAANVNSVVVKLNPDGVWGTRTQTLQVLGPRDRIRGTTPAWWPRRSTRSTRAPATP